MVEVAICAVDGCGRPAKARGLCLKCYGKAYYRGSIKAREKKDFGFCRVCSRPLKHWQGKYCSVECNLFAKKEKTKEKRRRICEYCGQEFIAHPLSGKGMRGESQEGRYCSRVCRLEGREPLYVLHGQAVHRDVAEKGGGCRIGDSRPIWIKNCRQCGGLFTAKYKASKLCSKACHQEEQRQRAGTLWRTKAKKDYETPVACKECGKIFVSEFGDKRRIYCSDKCGRQQGKTHIKRARSFGCHYEPVNTLRVFGRDGWRCQLCGKKLKPERRGSLHPRAPELDHIIPLSVGGEHSYMNTQCACRLCNQEKGNRGGGQLRLFG